MCIRDRDILLPGADLDLLERASQRVFDRFWGKSTSQLMGCLLYTSDAADERSSVDLGGRRIIKKKKQVQCVGLPLM